MYIGYTQLALDVNYEKGCAYQKSLYSNIIKKSGRVCEKYWDYLLDVMTLNWQEIG